jgi:hypothetical protein
MKIEKDIHKFFLDETQFGFRKGRPCIDSAFTTQILLEKRIEYNSERHFLL